MEGRPCRDSSISISKTGKPYGDSSLLGILSDNIMAIGQVAGRFISCERCGTTTVLHGVSLTCSNCAASYGLKPDTTFRGPTKKARPRLLVHEFTRPGVAKGINWFADSEKWTVTELVHSFLRLPMLQSLQPFLTKLGLPTPAESLLERVLFWPRLLFGK